jgi:hypothetical protein
MQPRELRGSKALAVDFPKFFATATELYNLWLRIPTIATLLVERTR